MSQVFKNFTGYNSKVGLIASISLDLSTAFDALVTQVTSDILTASDVPVSSVVPVTSFAASESVESVTPVLSFASIAKAATRFFKSKLALLFDFVIQFYKLLKLYISLEFKKRKISSRDSKCIRCIFGYYRSKYLRSPFNQYYWIIEFDCSVHNSFFTVYGGGV